MSACNATDIYCRLFGTTFTVRQARFQFAAQILDQADHAQNCIVAGWRTADREDIQLE